MEPLPEEDVFEALYIHALVLIDVDPLWTLLVLLKLGIPLSSIHGRQYSVWFPSDHRKSTLGQPRIATDPYNGED